jgi:hypothetical protein
MCALSILFPYSFTHSLRHTLLISVPICSFPSDTKWIHMCGSFTFKLTNFSLSSHSFFAVAGSLAPRDRMYSYKINRKLNLNCWVMHPVARVSINIYIETSVRNKCRCSFYCALLTVPSSGGL